MLDRQRVTTYGITTVAAATVALALWLKPWKTADITDNGPSPYPTIEQTTGHQVDVVFAVDTTGSMGGLLDGAQAARCGRSRRTSSRSTRRRTSTSAWSRIATPATKDYVTKDFALTDDLERCYAELASYRAEAGGDVPEDVDAALYDARPQDEVARRRDEADVRRRRRAAREPRRGPGVRRHGARGRRCAAST